MPALLLPSCSRSMTGLDNLLRFPLPSGPLPFGWASPAPSAGQWSAHESASPLLRAQHGLPKGQLSQISDEESQQGRRAIPWQVGMALEEVHKQDVSALVHRSPCKVYNNRKQGTVGQDSSLSPQGLVCTFCCPAGPGNKHGFTQAPKAIYVPDRAGWHLVCLKE